MNDHDIYVGMRNNLELQECKKINLFDIIIGVIRPDSEGESKSTMDIDVIKESTILIYNDGTLAEFEEKSKAAYELSKIPSLRLAVLSTNGLHYHES